MRNKNYYDHKHYGECYACFWENIENNICDTCEFNYKNTYEYDNWKPKLEKGVYYE